MGYGNNSNNLWHGIPLSQVRSAFFTDKFRTVYTMRKLIINGREHEFASADDGSVSMDGSYLNWMFISPLGVFSPSDFAGQTVGQFFDTIIDYTSEHMIKAWEDFADFIGPHYTMINSIFSSVLTAEVSAPGMQGSISFSTIPSFYNVSNFAELATWIKSILPASMVSMPATVLQSNASGGQYSFGVLLTMTVENGQSTATEAMSFAFVL